MPSKPKTLSDADQKPRSGFQFGIPAMIPGLVAGALVVLGVPVMAVALAAGPVASVTAFSVGVAAATGANVTLAAVAVMTGVAAAFIAGCATMAVAGVAAIAAANALVFVLGVAAAVTIAADAVNNRVGADPVPAPNKYSPKKIFAGIVAGSALGAAITFAATANAPQAPDSVVEDVSSSVLHTKTCGAGLCRDFNLAEQVAVSSAHDEAGRKTDTLTVPEARTLKL